MQTKIVSYTLLSTPLGWIGLAWHDLGLLRIHLPEVNKEETEKKLLQEFVFSKEEIPSHFVKECTEQILALHQGKPTDFSKIPIDLSASPSFHQTVYQEARRIPWGQTLTYGELASKAGKKGAARAVGQALAKNPLPLLIPCHRILAAGGKMGGFSAYGGTSLKEKLLLLEKSSSSFDPQKATQFLQKQDQTLGKIIKKIGPFTLFSSPPHLSEPYEALGRSIIYQQLAGKAAAAIFNRVKENLGKGEFPKSSIFLSASPEELRACGLSSAKASALKSLAEYALSGKLKTREEYLLWSDEEIIQSLLPIRGVGRWTAEMFLLFSLQRPDVLSLGDYGLKKGLQKLYQLSELPTHTEFAKYGEKWKPYRSIASFYLWRVLDE